MSQEDIIAKRYARGLAEYAIEAGQIDEVGVDLAHLADIVEPHSGEIDVPEFKDFLSTPVLTPEAKLEAADAILEKLGICKTVTDFFNVLVLRNRVELMPHIHRQFIILAAELTQEHAATVRTARPLTPDQADRLKAALTATLGGKVRLVQKIEAGLLAGVRVEVDGKVVDGTILGRLDVMRRKLLKI